MGDAGRSGRVRLGIIGFALALLALALPAGASAKTFSVNSTGDPVPGPCTKSDCTIREAFLAANEHAGADVIELRRGKTYTLVQPGQDENAGLTGDLDSTGKLTLRAAGKGRKRAVVDAALVDRAMQLLSPAQLNGIEIRNGAAETGGAIAGGGGLSLVRCRITSSGSSSGAVVLFEGDLKASRTSVVNNPGIGLAQSGPGSIILERSTVSGNGDGVNEHDAGSIKVIRSHIDRTDGQGLVEFDAGGISVNRSSVDRSDGQSVVEFGAGGIAISRTSVDRGEDQSLVEFDGGSISVNRSSVDHSEGQAIVEFGAGSITVGRSTVNDCGDQGLVEFDAGGVKLTRGHVNGADSEGVISFGSGVEGHVTIARSSVNGSGDTGVRFSSGDGDLKLSRSKVNDSVGDGVDAGGAKRARIDRVEISGTNNAGIYVPDGKLVLSRSTVTGNSGSGVYIGSSGKGELETSTISGNGAVNGGGVAVYGQASITNTTIAGNEASDFGGGIAADGASASVSLNAVTLVHNRAGTDGSGLGGISALDNATFRVKNSLLAENTGQAGDDSCAGQFLSGGGNLRTDVGSLCAGFDSAGDAVRGNARIGKLASNGGPTKTIALKKQSPAINRGRSSAPNRDQRDFKRIGKADSGAFEFGAVPGN